MINTGTFCGTHRHTRHTQAHSMVHTDTFYDTYKHILLYTQTHSMMINTGTFMVNTHTHTFHDTHKHILLYTQAHCMVHTSTWVLFRMQ